MAKKILIIDDSALMRRVLSDIINSDKRFKVQDEAKNGLEALDLIVNYPKLYDAIVLDVNMPKMDGLELLEQLQKNKITDQRIIMNSTLTTEGAKETIIALEKGALDFVTKPGSFTGVQSDDYKDMVINMLVVATGLYIDEVVDHVRPVIKKETVLQKESKTTVKERDSDNLRKIRHQEYEPHKKLVGEKTGRNKLVAIACSTGGPKSLKSVIPLLPSNLDAPILLVQHMPKGFTETLAIRLNETSKVQVKEATDGEIIKKGCVYIAPGGTHMKVAESKDGNYKIAITDEPPILGLKPCANIMFESLLGARFDEITCVVLTGMGADGTAGIGKLGEKNNIHVIAQDEKTSIVYGMPNAVAKANLTDEIVSLDRVADAIIKNVGVLTNGR